MLLFIYSFMYLPHIVFFFVFVFFWGGGGGFCVGLLFGVHHFVSFLVLQSS